MTPLTSAVLICGLVTVAALVWAIERLEKRVRRVEERAPLGRGIRAMPVTDADAFADWALDLDQPRIARAHIAPEPLPAAAHLGTRVDVSL
jgi:hypothetical protein